MAPRKAPARKTTSRRGATAPRSSSKAKARPPAKPRPPAAATARALVQRLGEVTCPSGTLAIFDIGLVGYLPPDALEPAMVRVDVPPDRTFAVTGTRVAGGRFADCWDHVSIDLAAGDVHAATKLGEVGVDFARLICIDRAALASWQHEDSLDGLADVRFWGRDEKPLARAMKAPRTKDGYGWSNLTVPDAEAKLVEAERLRASHRWLVKTDLRPHTHHYYALAAARANPTGAGELELAGSRLVLFFTSWGDGVFPIYLDLDADERPVRVRIQLASHLGTGAPS